MKSLLVLRLEGVLQSWGEAGKWGYRDTWEFPTKSGIIGLLGCALGWQRNTPDLFALSQALSIGVRADRRGILLTDFHTIQSKQLLNAQGKHRGLKGKFSTLISHRNYLQDAYFTVVLEGEREKLEQIYEALKHPKWPIYLGRKACIPSRPVYDQIYDCYQSIEEALYSLPLAERSSDIITAEIEKNAAGHLQGSCYFRNDARGRESRSFFSREVIRKTINGLKEGRKTDVSQ